MAKKQKAKKSGNTSLTLAKAMRPKRSNKNRKGLPSASNAYTSSGWGTQNPTTGSGGGTSYGA